MSGFNKKSFVLSRTRKISNEWEKTKDINTEMIQMLEFSDQYLVSTELHWASLFYWAITNILETNEKKNSLREKTDDRKQNWMEILELKNTTTMEIKKLSGWAQQQKGETANLKINFKVNLKIKH